MSLEPTPAKGRLLISRPLAGVTDDHYGKDGEADDEEEGEGDHRPPLHLPHLCSQQPLAVDCLSALLAMCRSAMNTESTIPDF